MCSRLRPFAEQWVKSSKYNNYSSMVALSQHTDRNIKLKLQEWSLFPSLNKGKPFLAIYKTKHDKEEYYRFIPTVALRFGNVEGPEMNLLSNIAKEFTIKFNVPRTYITEEREVLNAAWALDFPLRRNALTESICIYDLSSKLSIWQGLFFRRSVTIECDLTTTTTLL